MSAKWQDTLDETLESAQRDARSKNINYFFTLPRLIEILQAPSKAKLLDVIEKKISAGSLGVFYRIISPETKSVIAEFRKLSDIPKTIFDDSAGYEITIDPLSNIEVVFQVSPK